jgi:hypothetical protein
MSRPRKKGNRNLPDGLYPPSGKGCWRMRHPISGKIKTLDTHDQWEARKLYNEVMRRKPESPDSRREAIISSFLSERTLADLAKEYRETRLDKAVTRKGRPLGENTRRTYANYLKNFEDAPDLQVAIEIFSDPDRGLRILRAHLKAWLDQPKTYNYRLSCLSRLFGYAVEIGLISRNPCFDIERKSSKDRDVYMSDDHYIAITVKLTEMTHEVYARACDWIYLISGRPTDMLGIKETNITDKVVEYFAGKNQQLVNVERDEEINYLIDWFRDYKKQHGINSPYLIVHPLEARRKLGGKPITTALLYRYLKKAMNAAELPIYTLRDLRPKALTDEATNAGMPTNKGAHRTEQMRKHYVKKMVPVEVKNTLKRIGKD